MKKMMISMVLALSMCLSVFSAHAGIEDWQGQYKIKSPQGEVASATHTSTYVSFLFFRAGTGISLSKGMTLNGVTLSESIELMRDSDPKTFEQELSKFGTVIQRDVTFGETYPK